jgi:hypothetical protein
LLGFDTRFHIDQLDRKLALDFLNDDFIRALALPNELKLLGPNSRWTPESLFTEIRQAADQGASELRLFLHGEADTWELLGNLRGYLTQWQSLYSELVLVLVNVQLEQLSNETKEDLWVLSRLGIRIAVLDKNKQNYSYPAFAQAIRTAGPSQQAMVWTWACIGSGTEQAVENWLETSENLLIVATDYPLLPVSRDLAADSLKPQAGTGDVEVEILTECNGSLANFGTTFWRIVGAQHLPLQGHWRSGELLLSIRYCDRYLNSPLTMLLLAALLAGLRNQLADKWGDFSISIMSAPKKSDGNFQKRRVFSDWQGDDTRKAVFENYFAALGMPCSLHIDAAVPHGRVLELSWQSGAVTRLRFDQGMGYWSCSDRQDGFDFSLPPDQQVSTLQVLAEQLSVKNHTGFATQIFVKETRG